MITLLLALAPPAAATAAPRPVAPQTAPSIAVPIPLPPPVAEPMTGFIDGPRYTLVHTLPGNLPGRREDQGHSIAAQRWFGAQIATLLPDERSATFLCTISDEGVLAPTTLCTVERPSPNAVLLNRLGFLLRPAIAAGPAPDAAAAPDGRRSARALRFTLRLDPADWPAPWAPSGQPSLTGSAGNPLYSLMQRRWADRYPPAALRAGASALVMVDCGVEADRSVSCRTQSITPPASEPYFRDVIEQPIPSGLAPATLSDGRATPGMEFRVPLRFMMAS